MLKRRKILVTTGTRAEYGILRPVLKKIHESKKLDLLLVVTGTHNSKKSVSYTHLTLPTKA